MVTSAQVSEAKQYVWKTVNEAGIAVRDEEFSAIEITDLGLGELDTCGLQILSLANTPWVAVKLVALRPHQFCPQHRHPPSPSENYPGKQEILRVQCGEVFLNVPGDPPDHVMARPPERQRRYCTVWHEVVLHPGDQYIVAPNTWHWFQAGANGVLLWSFSSRSTDAQDEFVDPDVVRFSILPPE